MISMISILGADFLGHFGGNLNWNILAVLYGLGRTILLGDFVAFFNRDLLTRFRLSAVFVLGCLAHFLIVSLALLSVSRLTALLVLGGTFLDVGCGVICHPDSLALRLVPTLDTDSKASNNELR